MPLDPHAASILQFLTAVFPDLGAQVVDPVEARRIVAKIDFPRGPEVSKLDYRSIPGPPGAPDLAVRIYWPRSGRGRLPVVVYFHGGGFVLCNLDTHDGICRTIAHDAEMIVVSVDYRLAPEHKWPAAVDDAYAAISWAAGHAAELGGDPARVAVAGDSSGGTLAAVGALRARDEGGPGLACQLLVCPALDLDPGGYPSRTENAEGYFMTDTHIRWYADQYLDDPAQAAHPYVAPMRAADLTGLPSAVVITAEYDPLRDEGEAYAARLAAAGVPTRARRMRSLFHGFLGMGAFLPLARAAELQVTTALHDALAPPP